MPFAKGATEAVAEAASFDDLATTLAVAVGVVVLAVVVIPLVLFGIELILLGLVIAVAILGRAFLGRPWVIEAKREGDESPSYVWQTRGWRSSRRLIDEVEQALAEGRDPIPAEGELSLPLNASTA